MMSQYEVKNVKVSPYLAAGDGVTDDTKAIQAAIDDGGVVFFPAGVYMVGPLDLTNKSNLMLLGNGQAQLLPIPNHSAWGQPYGHIIDLSGSSYCTLRDLWIGAPSFSGTLPATGIFIAQTPNGAVNALRFDNVYLTGQYRAAAFYNYGGVSSQIYSCKFYNYLPGGNHTRAGVFSGRNVTGLQSQFTTIVSDQQPAGNWSIFGTEWHNFPGAGGNGSTLLFDWVSDVNFFGGVVTGGGQEYFGVNGAVSRIMALGLTFETEGEPAVPQYLFYVYGGSSLSDVALLGNYQVAGATYGGAGSHP
jgi:hypothetical protein